MGLWHRVRGLTLLPCDANNQPFHQFVFALSKTLEKSQDNGYVENGVFEPFLEGRK